jgi:deoxyribonuclease V
VIVCVDVDYRDREVVAAAVGFAAWTDAEPAVELTVTSDAPPAPYEPGAFYRRELPHILGALALLVPPFEAIVVDGYVWLGPHDDPDAEPGSHKPGLGAHLYLALGGAMPVIGVAKTAFEGAIAIEVLRGESAKPLYVTAVGIDAAAAADRIRTMHGEHRLPTLLKRADQLARGNAL